MGFFDFLDYKKSLQNKVVWLDKEIVKCKARCSDKSVRERCDRLYDQKEEAERLLKEFEIVRCPLDKNILEVFKTKNKERCLFCSKCQRWYNEGMQVRWIAPREWKNSEQFIKS